MGKLIDLTGRKFGRLTVIKRASNSKSGCVRWLCKCSCENEKIILGDSLRTGATRSCGCIVRLSPGPASLHQLIGAYKRNSKKRGLEYNLTEEHFAELTKKDCYYCGTKPNNFSKAVGNSEIYVYNGLDRIDNNKGYTLDNVVPCCHMCNEAKSNHTLQEFKDWSGRLYKNMFKKEVIL